MARRSTLRSPVKRKKMSDALRKERKRAGPLEPKLNQREIKKGAFVGHYPGSGRSEVRKRINFKMRKAAIRKTGMGGSRKGGKVNPRALKGTK